MLDIPKAASKLRKLAADQTVVRLPDAKPLKPTSPVPGQQEALQKPVVKRLDTGVLIKWSFVALVVLPTVLAGLYFAFIASDQYSAEAQFAVRSKETSGSMMDGLTLLSGISGSTANMADSYIVTNFIGSRDLVGKIDADLNLRTLYNRPEADYLAAVDPDAPIEDLVEYWQSMVTTEFDKYAGIIRLEVKAFRPEDAVAVAQKVIGYSESLVNDLSRRAREDAVSESLSEVQRAENRLRLARRAVTNFRGAEMRLNPVATAEAREKIIGELEAELAKLETELTVLQSVSPNSPRVASITSQASAVRQQIAAVRSQTNSNDTRDEATLNQQLAQYEELQTEREFAEKAYVSSLASLEKARVEAASQTRYLSVFVEPRVPDTALYPEGLRWVFIIFIGSFLVWAISGLIVAGVRDHVV